MFEEDIELAIKVLIVGNGAVGKSSMIQRYCKGIFTHEYKKTIGVDFLEKKIQFVAPLLCYWPVECGAWSVVRHARAHLWQNAERRHASDDLGHGRAGGV
jgi:hypothetical protein